MKGTDDKHSDHDLKAYFDGRDGVSAAYRQTAREEPPAALDAAILKAARSSVKPAPAGWHARKSYALAASVMIAVAAVSLYFGSLDDSLLQPEAPTAQADAPVNVVELAPRERAESAIEDAATEAAPQVASNAGVREFERRQLAPPVATVGAQDTAGAPASAAAPAVDAFARDLGEPATTVIDGPFLEQLEAEAAAAAADQTEEITVTGSRIMAPPRNDVSYRASREEWLDELRALRAELERVSRVTVAQRNRDVLENRLDEEIELFLEAYPDTDIEAELEREE